MCFFSYELANGQFFEEKGYLKEDGSQVKEGSYSFVDPDGNTQTVNYSADDTGFHPVIGKQSNIFFEWNSETDDNLIAFYFKRY